MTFPHEGLAICFSKEVSKFCEWLESWIWFLNVTNIDSYKHFLRWAIYVNYSRKFGFFVLVFPNTVNFYLALYGLIYPNILTVNINIK